MARIIGDKALNDKLTRLARGVNVTPALLRAAERTRQVYVESVQEQSPGRPDTRYGPRREVVAAGPGEAPNSDTGYLVNMTGTQSDRVNQAEAFSSASYAEALEFGTNYLKFGTDDLEFGTHKMAPRPAMGPAFEQTKAQVIKDVRDALRKARE